MRAKLIEECRSRLLICDGAMGTQLIARGLKPSDCGMAWNVERPGDIRAVHADYAAAGCEIITTNSFGGTRTMLARHGLGEQVAALNRAAVELARQAGGADRWVFADVGPFGDFLEPLGETTIEELEDIFCEQVAALAEGGADAVLIETMSAPEEVAAAVRAAKTVAPGLPVAATYAFQRAGNELRTMMGTTVGDAMRAAIEAGADIVGANCGTDLGFDDYVRLAGELLEAAGPAPVMLQPNAGAPKQTADGHIFYDASPEEMAGLAVRLRQAGVAILGGCCGTTPAHLAAMANALAGLQSVAS